MKQDIAIFTPMANEEKNAKKILSNLRFLHNSWKQDAVPVAKEHREETWSAFKELSDKIFKPGKYILGMSDNIYDNKDNLDYIYGVKKLINIYKKDYKYN